MSDSWKHDWNPRKAEAAAADDGANVAEKLGREALLLLKGTGGGFVHGLDEAVHDPLGTGVRVAGTFGLGLALTYMQRRTGVLGLGSQIVGSSLALSFVGDVLAPGRWSAVADAMSDTWHSKSNFDKNVNTVQNNLGRFACDTAIMSASGALGATVGRMEYFPRGIAVSDVLRGLNGEYGKWEGPRPRDVPAHFDNFPYRAKSFIESGKDAIVIELENNRILKILKKPLPPDAGNRFFDLPILEQGSVYNGRLKYIIQPKVEINQSKQVMNDFYDMVRRAGYNFWDREPTQLGFFKGKVVLVDYDAVAKLSVDLKI